MGKSGSGEAGRCVKRSRFREKELAHEAIGTFVIFQDQECVFVSKLTHRSALAQDKRVMPDTAGK